MKKQIIILSLLFIGISGIGQTYVNSTEMILSVSNVSIATNLLTEVNYKTALEIRTNCKIESYNIEKRNDSLIPVDAHAFIAALHIAFAQHRPIVISPDMIWLLIVQGVSIQLILYSEELKDEIVNFNNEKEIIIKNNDFIKGAEFNDWKIIFPQFSDSIKSYINTDLYNLFTNSFSTTTINEKIAFEIALMSAVDNYFDYSLVTECGIPEIKLLGNVSDWELIYKQCEKLKDFGLGSWYDNLKPILSEFVNASKGEINTIFWKSIYKWTDMSGGPYITGWIIKFFPYIIYENKYIENPFMLNENMVNRGLLSENIPSGLSMVELKWESLEDMKIYDMLIYSGFMGIQQDNFSKYLKPEISWCIRDKNSLPFKEIQNTNFENKIDDKIVITKNKELNNDSDLLSDTLINELNLDFDYNEEIYFAESENTYTILDTLYVNDCNFSFYTSSIYEIEKYSENSQIQKPNLYPKQCINYEESMQLLQKNISEQLIKENLEYEGSLIFIISWFGTVEKVQIKNSSNPDLDEKIISILKNISGCEPALINGENFNTRIYLKISI